MLRRLGWRSSEFILSFWDYWVGSEGGGARKWDDLKRLYSWLRAGSMYFILIYYRSIRYAHYNNWYLVLISLS